MKKGKEVQVDNLASLRETIGILKKMNLAHEEQGEDGENRIVLSGELVKELAHEIFKPSQKRVSKPKFKQKQVVKVYGSSYGSNYNYELILGVFPTGSGHWSYKLANGATVAESKLARLTKEEINGR